jgi:hypothetical protein
VAIESRIVGGTAWESARPECVAQRRHPAAILPVCGGIILAASLFIFVLALKPFAFGVWYQSESVTAALFAGGSGAALCLAFMAAFGFPVGGALRHPVVLVTGGLGIWSALTAIEAPLPMRSFFGPAETGEGVLWYFTLAVQTALALMVWPDPRIRRMIVGAGIVAGLTIVGLNVPLPIHSPWRPAVWPEFAAYLGIYLLAIVASGISVRWPGIVGRMLARIPMVGAAIAAPGTPRLLAALLVGMAIIMTSQNKTAIALALAGLPAAMLATVLIRHRGLRMAVTITVAVLAPLGIVGGMYWLGIHQHLESPLSRTAMSRLVVTALESEPQLLLHGTGWGAFNDVLYRYGYLVRDATLATETWQQSLGHTGGGAFHSHNGFLEATLSTGLLGGLLYLAIPLTAILCSRRRHGGLLAGVWIVSSGLSAAWFALPLVVPFQALALAATVGGTPCRHPTRPRFTPTFRRILGGSAIVCCAILLATGAILTTATALRGDRLLKTVGERAPTDPLAHEYLLPDNDRGGAHLWWIALDYGYRLKEKGEAGPLTGDQLRWFDILLRAVDWQAEHQPTSLRLKTLRVILRDILATSLNDSRADPLRRREVPRWGQAVQDLLAQAPHRSDVAIPYLSLLLQTGNGPVAVRFANTMLLRNPDDPVALWFSGLSMLSRPPWTLFGKARLMHSIDAGVGRVMPIDGDLRTTLEAERDKAL